MVVFGVKIIVCDKLKDLVKSFNDNLEINIRGLEGQVFFMDDVLIFYLENNMSMFDLPKLITFWSIRYKWKKKGYEQRFILIKNKELLRLLISEVCKDESRRDN